MNKDQPDNLKGLRDELIAVLQKYDVAGIIQVTGKDVLRSFSHIEASWLPFKTDYKNNTARCDIPEGMAQQEAEQLLELGFELLYQNICMLEETRVFHKRMLAHFLKLFDAEEAFWESKRFKQQGRSKNDSVN